jgi:hypothetical protein
MQNTALIFVALCWLAAGARAPASFDVVVKSGRVIDPETSLNDVAPGRAFVRDIDSRQQGR